MDVLTASIALTIVQLCVSLVMAGLFIATPAEKCTRYWAVSGALVAVGVLMVTLNAGAPRYAILVIGNNALIIGLILQWTGTRLFHGKRPSRLAWLLGIGFFICYAVLLLNNASIAHRALLASVWTLAVLLLNFREIWAGQSGHRSFGNLIALASLCILIACYIARVIGTLYQMPSFMPANASSFGIVSIYLGPMAGAQLLFSGILLLFFEKIVQEKNHLATHDSLTGILNRRAIDAAGERELEVASRLNHSLGIAFVDIDHFKQINDNSGHEAGDHVLAEVAHILKRNCRNIDLVGRNGGDEFCLILPGVDPQYLTAIGARLVKAVSEHEIRTLAPISISVGLVLWNKEGGNESWQKLLSRADAELYKAKAQGRNRFSMSSAVWQNLPAAAA